MYRRQFIGVFSFLGIWFGKGAIKPEENSSPFGGMDLEGDYLLSEQTRKKREAEEKEQPILDVYG